MSVYLERFKTGIIDNESNLDHLFFKKEYDQFLPWWEKNKNQFSRLSFNIENQSYQFIDDFRYRFNFDTAFSKIKMDLWGFYLEYIKQQGILPFTNRIKDNRLVGDFYGDKPISDLTNPQERDGAVLQAMMDLEQKLLEANIGDMIFRVSPKGWTGMGYDYTETQMQILWKENKNIVRGLTVRTDLNLPEILSFIHLLTGNDHLPHMPHTLEDKESEVIKTITASNFKLKNTDLGELFGLIAQITENKDHQGNDLIKQFRQWINTDQNFDSYDQIVNLIDWLKSNLSKIYKENQISSEQIKSLLAFVLIQLGEKERREKEIGQTSFVANSSVSFDTRYPLPTNYQETFNYLLAQPGCAGGAVSQRNGLFAGVKLTPFGTTGIENSESDRYPDYQCPHCGETIRGEKKGHPEEWHKECPHCHTPLNCAK
jgi:predicted RNA-binding Zn-ribbon protein involved in translation (DUF1610 family)/CRISPR/Cas system CSM-associated protein Csm2 small subunit